MVSFWRATLSYVITITFLFATMPAGTAQAMSESDRWEEIKEVMELATPVRKSEAFAEMYYRMETRLADSQKREIAELNKKLDFKIANVKVPEAKVTADSIVLKDGEATLEIKVKKNDKGELAIYVNDKMLTQKQAQSPLLTYEFLQKMSPTKEKKISSWIWHQFVPESNAFAFTWPLIIAGGLAIAGIGYLVYKKFFKKEETCKDKDPVCCNLNGTLTQLSNGCCTEASGIATSYSTCPTPMYIDGTSTGTTDSSGTSTDSATSTGVQ